LAKSPPTTLMTGTSTQMMLDIADLVEGVSKEEGAIVRVRLATMSASVGSFAAGCALGALAILWLNMFAFIIPSIVSFASFIAPRQT
jgi:uncharacterized membrane protein YoaK (UPF0700 family)